MKDTRQVANRHELVKQRRKSSLFHSVKKRYLHKYQEISFLYPGHRQNCYSDFKRCKYHHLILAPFNQALLPHSARRTSCFIWVIDLSAVLRSDMLSWISDRSWKSLDFSWFVFFWNWKALSFVFVPQLHLTRILSQLSGWLFARASSSSYSLFQISRSDTLFLELVSNTTSSPTHILKYNFWIICHHATSIRMIWHWRQRKRTASDWEWSQT